MKVLVRNKGAVEVQVVRVDDNDDKEWRDYQVYYKGPVGLVYVGRVTTAWFRTGGWSWTPGKNPQTGITSGYPTRKEAIRALMYMYFGMRL